MNRSSWPLPLLWIGLSFFLGCHRDPAPTGPRLSTRPAATDTPTYHFAIHPLHNPAKLVQAYQPLMAALNSHIPGARFEMEASRDYANYEEKIDQRKAEFLLPNPWQTLMAIKRGYSVIASAGSPEDFRGTFVARKDSGIRNPSDLKGKAVSYPSATALAACVMPQYYLHSHGIDIHRDIRNEFVGSQESSIMNAYLKKSSVAATWPVPWRAFQKEHPGEAAELEVIWETESLINNSVMARDDVPVDIRKQVQSILVQIQTMEGGKEILLGMETSRFTAASNRDYQIVQDYVAKFEREVRPIKGK
jgi:phosphonate transport system substrate-binding protein